MRPTAASVFDSSAFLFGEGWKTFAFFGLPRSTAWSMPKSGLKGSLHMSHITGAAVAKASEAPEKLRVLWVGLCYRSAVCAVSRGLGCLFWNGAIRCDWRPSSFFIAGGIRECPFYVPLGLKWWAVSTVCKNEKGESVEGSAHGYTRFPGGLLCASVNVVYRHALH